MANDSTAEGFVAFMAKDVQRSSGSYLTIAGILALGFLIHKLLFVSIDPREPPVLKPRVPIIGHLLGILQYHGVYLRTLQFVQSNNQTSLS